MNNENKPVITPIGRQTWIVGTDFKVEIPISNADTAWAEGKLHMRALHSWNKDKGILTLTGHPNEEISDHVVTVYAVKDGNQVEHTIYYDVVLPNS